MNEYMMPDELLGPISLDALQRTPSEYERITDDMFPDCHVAFLDEVNNASGAIQNFLLKAMNERRIRIGKNVVNLPLKSIMAATNHDFEPGKMDAFTDRWLIKLRVHPVSSKYWDDLLFGKLDTPSQVSNLQELEQAHDTAMGLSFSTDAANAYKEIMFELKTKSQLPSPRRCRNATKLCKARAHIEGASEVALEHMDILRYAMFTHEAERMVCEEVVTNIANPALKQLQDQMVAMQQVLDGDDSPGVKAGKLRKVKSSVQALRQSRKTDKVIAELDDEIQRNVMLEMDVDIEIPAPPQVA